MTKAKRRNPKGISIVDLIRLCKAVSTHARKYASRLPAGDAEPNALDALADGLQAAEDARIADARERFEAIGARDALYGEAAALYGSALGWTRVAARRKSGSEALRGVLRGCPAPSRVKIGRLPQVMENLAAGVEANAALFVSTRLDAALIAQLREKAQALREASDALAASESDRNEATNLRDQARDALVEQLRLVEEELDLVMPAEGFDGLEGIYNRYLPRYEKKETPAEPAG